MESSSTFTNVEHLVTLPGSQVATELIRQLREHVLQGHDDESKGNAHRQGYDSNASNYDSMLILFLADLLIQIPTGVNDPFDVFG